MSKTESIDVMDALGAAIRVDTRGREVMRILPRNNDAVNEEWITDKTRHVADGLRTQRLDQPYLRRSGRLEPATWAEALDVVAKKLKGTAPERIGAIAGDLCGAEEMFALKALMSGLGVANLDCRQDGAKLDPALGRASYLFNSTVEGIEKADAILLVGTNPRMESAVLNGRIRKRWRQGGLSVGLVGEAADLTYGVDHLGIGPDTLQEIAEGKSAFSGVLRQAQHPMVIVGMGAAARPDGPAVLALATKFARDAMAGKDAGWNAFNLLHTAAARVGGLDLGFVPGKGGLDVAGMMAAAAEGALDVVYLLGADEIDMNKLDRAFVIYQGSHGDAGAHRADVILPGAAYTEKDAIYVNLEGRPQMAAKAAFAPGEAREDWTILRQLSAVMGATLPFDDVRQLRALMLKAAPMLAALDTVTPAAAAGVERLAERAGKLDPAPFVSPVRDFFMTNPIARASAVMAELSIIKAGSGRIRAAAE
jgi:NADH-quinone oxidoreductase subunit G